MAVLTAKTKITKMTQAMSLLALEYAQSDKAGDKETARVLHRAMLDLPDDSKARLFDILVSG